MSKFEKHLTVICDNLKARVDSSKIEINPSTYSREKIRYTVEVEIDEISSETENVRTITIVEDEENENDAVYECRRVDEEYSEDNVKSLSLTYDLEIDTVNVLKIIKNYFE